VDLDQPETVTPAVSEADLVVNLVAHPGLVPERAVLRSGGVLIDVSVRSATAIRPLRKQEPNARGVVLVNAGRTPGVSNLVVADLLSAFPTADAVEVVFSFSASSVFGPAAGEFLHRHLTAEHRRRPALVPFPPPLGHRRCVPFGEGEQGWLGALAKDCTVETYARFSPAYLNTAVLALDRIGLLSRLPRAAFVRGSTAPQATASSEPVSEWVAVRRGDVRLAARTIEGSGGYRLTAAAVAVFADALLDDQGRATAKPGCFDPQDLFSLSNLQPQLVEAGIRVTPQPTS
jgi:hypothetical protein